MSLLDRLAGALNRVLGPPKRTSARVFYSPALSARPPSLAAERRANKQLHAHGLTRLVDAVNTTCLRCGQDDGDTVLTQVGASEWQWLHPKTCP